MIPAPANGDGEPEGEDDGEAARLRRRRGRRGGRRRGWREDGLGAVDEIGRPAPESIEIVAIDGNEPGERGYVYGELAAVIPTRQDLPSVPGSAPDALATASLPARAGELAPGTPLPPTAEPAATSPETLSTGDGWPEPFAALAGEPGSDGGNPPAGAFVSAISASHPNPPPLAGEGGEGETQFTAGPSAPPSEEELKAVVQEVTKKPENPRRGWWQRLIQP